MIIGGKVSTVKATRKGDAPVNNMGVNVAVTDASADRDALKIKYTFTVHYEPEVAEITVEGEVHAQEKDAKNIAEQWKKNKQLPPALAEDLLTGINYAGQAVGTLAAFALGIQAPLTVPRARLDAPKNAPAS